MALSRIPSSWRSVGIPLVAVTLFAGATFVSGRHQPAPRIPAVLSNIAAAADGTLELHLPGQPPFPERERAAPWTLRQLAGSPRGTETGIALDFHQPGFAGTLVFGLLSYHDTRYPQPVYRTTTPIADGKASIDITRFLAGTYDMIGWHKSGTGVIGYRIITASGAMIYDGRVRFTGTGPFDVGVTIIEGPFVSNVTPQSAIVWFELSRPAACSVTVGSRVFACRGTTTREEVRIDGLAPATDYAYTVRYDGFEETYGFRTAPPHGARAPFTFGYASDSRGGPGGGERSFTGPNAYIMRRLMATAHARRAAFVTMTGDLVGGGVTSRDAMLTELANWKRATELQWHWIPVYTGIGNHEAVVREFLGPNNRVVRVDRFPYETESMEAVFASAFVNPENGPASEDGAVYDPDPAAVDFPSYRENVYFFTYANTAMVMLNSNYWYTPTFASTPETGGNPHGYLMDNQVAWLASTLAALERDPAIDHVFLTVHTPMFPNGGHVGDDMWYRGSNVIRPRVAGTPVARGIIERRDDLLALIQRHPKVLAVLTGDEHNYNRLRLAADVPIYPEDWTGPRVTLKRPFYQINNGAAGAPYYAQEQTPWSAFVKGFSTQNALCLLHVEGRRVRLEVVNPETLEVLDQAVLR